MITSAQINLVLVVSLLVSLLGSSLQILMLQRTDEDATYPLFFGQLRKVGN